MAVSWFVPLWLKQIAPVSSLQPINGTLRHNGEAVKAERSERNGSLERLSVMSYFFFPVEGGIQLTVRGRPNAILPQDYKVIQGVLPVNDRVFRPVPNHIFNAI